MPEQRGVRDGRFCLGLGALLCGLVFFTAGLRDDDARLETMALGAPTARVAGWTPDEVRPLISACACDHPPGSVMVMTAPAAPPMTISRQASRPPRERFPGDEGGMAGWTSGDARNELLRTAEMRWLRESKARDDASGYASVEASRSSCDSCHTMAAPTFTPSHEAARHQDDAASDEAQDAPPAGGTLWSRTPRMQSP